MTVQPGDVIRVPAGDHGHDHRIGGVLEVGGTPGHERLRVRWEDDHESLYFPSRGVRILHPGGGETFVGRTEGHAQTWEPLEDD